MLKKLVALAAVTLVGQGVSASGGVFETLKAHCGKAFQGKVVRYNDSDDAWRKATLVMHVRDCFEDEIRVPLHVDDDRSRVWIISKTAAGLRLKHDHRHENGHPDDVTMYGGDSVIPRAGNKGQNATSVAFPVDAETIKIFEENGLTASVSNVWYLGTTESSFSYRLTRANRDFMVTFDLTKTVPLPPAAWDKVGH